MTTENWQAHGTNVLLRMLPEESEVGGIGIPDSGQDRPKRGIVVDPGTGIKTESGNVIPNDVEVGETVLVSKFGGHDIDHDGVKYRIVAADDVICGMDDTA